MTDDLRLDAPELPSLRGFFLEEDLRATAHEIALLDVIKGPEASNQLLNSCREAGRYLHEVNGRWVANEQATLPSREQLLETPFALARSLSRLARYVSRPETQAELLQVSCDLHDRISGWNAQRLWADNRVRELVVHDERHSQRVDALAAQLVAPLLLQEIPAISPREAEALSAAAWLHDWGHEGGEVAPNLVGTIPHMVVEQAEEVRVLHGIVTRELLSDDWRARHLLPPELASVVGILCAHHQGWTSFGQNAPSKQVAHQGRTVEVTPPSLAQDTIAHNARFRNSQERWANFNPDRARRLVALLRVADGCDLGVHRVPDAGAPKQAYLARAIQVRCRAARAAVHGSDLQQDMIHESLAAIHAVSQRARDVADIELRIANSTDTYSDLAARMLRELDRVSSVPAIRELAAYVTFAADQANFYAQHGAVADVRFDVQRAAPNATYRYEVSVVVVPSSKELLSQAVNSVHTDLARELSRGDRANDVRDCLLEAGLRFMDVRSAGFGQGKKEPLS